MKRMGIYSGKIYEDNDENMHRECCLVLTEAEAKLDKIRLKLLQWKHNWQCKGCHACPEAQQKRSV